MLPPSRGGSAPAIPPALLGAAAGNGEKEEEGVPGDGVSHRRYYDPGLPRQLSNELERRYDLQGLRSLCTRVLKVEAEEVGGAAAPGALARSLVDACLEGDAVWALLDVLKSEGEGLHPLLQLHVNAGVVGAAALSRGDSFGRYLLLKQISSDELSVDFWARCDGDDYRLQVLGYHAALDTARLQRLQLTLARAAGVEHVGLEVGGRLERPEGMPTVVNRYVEGERLDEQIARAGSLGVSAGRRLLKALLEPLAELHKAGLCHGQICTKNVLVTTQGQGHQGALWLGIGRNWLWDGTLAHAPALAMAPELVKGEEPTPRSDVYALGAMLYEVLSGEPVFDRAKAGELAMAHLTEAPPKLSEHAGAEELRGLDAFVARSLSKDPSERPQDATEFLAQLKELGSVSVYPRPVLSEEQVSERLEALRASPEDRACLSAVVDTISQGTDARQVGDQLWQIAQEVVGNDTRLTLLKEAAAVYSGPADYFAGAQTALFAALQFSPGDCGLISALAGAYERAGHLDSMVQMLAQQAPEVTDAAERGRLYARAGRTNEVKLAQLEPALDSYLAAFLSEPGADYHIDVERLAAQVPSGWERVLEHCAADAQWNVGSRPDAAKLPVLAVLGRWYERLGVPDSAEFYYQAVLDAEPGDAVAFEALCGQYRRQERWRELAELLQDFAEGPSAGPSEGRDWLAEAAQLQANRLGRLEGAVHLLQKILEVDPGHEGASEELLRIYGQAGDWPRCAAVLKMRAQAARGEARCALLCRVARLYEEQLRDDEAAIALYKEVLHQVPAYSDAALGVERVYRQGGRYQELLDTLIWQLDVAETPRLRAQLWQRIGDLYESEFLDHSAALNAFEKALELDPSHAEGVAHLARLCRSAGDWEKLAQAYEGYLGTLAPGEDRTQVGLALAELQAEKLGDSPAVVRTLEALLDGEERPAEVVARLATVKMQSGDIEGGLLHFEELAERLHGPQERAMHYTRVGLLLEQAGRLEEAVERYKHALDVDPSAQGAAVALQGLYERQGDNAALFELIKSGLDGLVGNNSKAAAYARLARLAWEGLSDAQRAEDMAVRADALDPTQLDASYVLGRIFYQRGQFAEAASYLERLMGHFERYGEQWSLLWCEYARALAESGRGAAAVATLGELCQRAPDEVLVLETAADICYDHGEPGVALTALRALEARSRQEMPTARRAEVLYRLGQSAHRAGYLTEAIAALQDAVSLDGRMGPAMRALIEAYQQAESWQEVADTIYWALDTAEGEERYGLLVQLGDVSAQHLGEFEYAIKNYLFAYKQKPGDRRLLLRLMQLYADGEQWQNLIDVITKLVDLVEEPGSKARYLRVAGQLASDKLGDAQRGAELLERALSYSPEQEGVLETALRVSRHAGDGQRLRDLLKREIRIASKHHDKGRMMVALGELADVYLNRLGRVHQTIAVHEGALSLDPDNVPLQEYLADAYTTHSTRYLEKAISLQQKVLDREPLRDSAYRALRHLYTQARDADAAWCVCRALTVLELASKDETDFFERVRSGEVAVAQDGMAPGEWTKLLLHPDCDANLSGVFMIIQPAVLACCAQNWVEYATDHWQPVNPVGNPAPLLGSLAYIADVLGVAQPRCVVDPRAEAALTFVPLREPVYVAGPAALEQYADVQEAAFAAAQALVRQLAGVGLHGLLSSTVDLKTWLFAALRMVHPQLAVPPEVASDVPAAVAWLQTELNANRVEQLVRVVNKLLRQSEPLDLKTWEAGVDYTADRLGLLFCDDLDVAVRYIRATDGYARATTEERLAAVCRYSVSAEYLQARSRLGVNLSAG